MNINDLLTAVNHLYCIHANEMVLLRDMIGRVYLIQSQVNRYVLKIYRIFAAADAIQTIAITDYLFRCWYPAVKAISTVDEKRISSLDMPEDRCPAILFEYIEGTEPESKKEIERIGRQIGELHNIMEFFPYGLINRSKYGYIDAYTSYMGEMEFESSKIDDIIAIRHFLIVSRIIRSQGLQCISMGFCFEQ